MMVNQLRLLARALCVCTFVFHASAQVKYRELYQFSGTDSPNGIIAVGNALYGAIEDSHCGSIFELQPPAAGQQQWSRITLYTFTGVNGDACVPNSLTAGPNGTLYGTSIAGGGRSLDGTVFELQPPVAPGEPWSEAVIYAFSGTDGGSPFGNVVLAPDGSLYGASSIGAFGYGNVFKLQPPATPGGEWTETVLYDFSSSSDNAKWRLD